MPKVRFVDLGAQYLRFRKEILEIFDSISKTGHYVFGPHLRDFESKFAEYCGTSHAIGVANGSDALYLVMKALGIGPGDEVITAPNSFIASAWTIANTGARVRFCDVGADMNMAPEALESAITPRTKAIMPVHLTGRVARMDRLNEIAERHGLLVIEDAAQSVGATYRNQRAGSFGVAAGFSLHPLKNLHVHGDGGAITTNDSALVEKINKWRNHGLRNRDECEFWGINSRLDAIQAAIAAFKIDYLDELNDAFRGIAHRYSQALGEHLVVPDESADEKPVYHRYMVRHSNRDGLARHLAEAGIDSKVNYPIPIHLQPAAAELGYQKGDFPMAESLANTILSLPIYPELPDKHVDYVIDKTMEFCRKEPNTLGEE